MGGRGRTGGRGGTGSAAGAARIGRRQTKRPLDRMKVCGERVWRDFVERGVATGKSAAVFLAGGDDVVVHERVHDRPSWDFRVVISEFKFEIVGVSRPPCNFCFPISAPKRLLIAIAAVSHGCPPPRGPPPGGVFGPPFPALFLDHFFGVCTEVF